MQLLELGEDGLGSLELRPKATEQASNPPPSVKAVVQQSTPSAAKKRKGEESSVAAAGKKKKTEPSGLKLTSQLEREKKRQSTLVIEPSGLKVTSAMGKVPQVKK